MTETIFEIAAYNRPLQGQQPKFQNTYENLQQKFSACSYGFYTQYFLKKIVVDAERQHPHSMAINLKKYLRRCVRNFMLTDLQLVFLAYFCNISCWEFQGKKLFRDNGKMNENVCNDSNQQENVQLFISLNAYFIKSYLGNIQQWQAIEHHYTETFPKFAQIYQKWVMSKSKQFFYITPRLINQLYRQYSRSAHIETQKKDYNDLVQTLIDLSTTYSIIPNRKNDKKQKNIKEHESQMENQIFSSKNKNSSGQSIVRRSRNNPEIYKIAEHQQLQEQQIPRFGTDLKGSRIRRKSSLLFQSLQSLNKKSQQLVNQNKLKTNQISVQEAQRIQRSRQKKPANKISLNFKKKQKPNQTVLGFIKQPTVIDQVSDQRNRSNNRSILNQHVNMSFVNLRSNRSSRTNSQLPFLWQPSEQNFFQKSKFG